MSDSEKKKFLHDELFSLTLMATVQRGHVYRDSVTDSDKRGFQDALCQRLTAMALSYTTSKTDAEHEQNIVSVASSVSASHGAVLVGGRFRIGSAQKALNLFLKYLWCVGEIPVPPHCPFDYRIIQMLPTTVRCKWTELDSIVGYRDLVSAARQEAGDRSLSEWELHAYNDGGPADIGGRSVKRTKQKLR